MDSVISSLDKKYWKVHAAKKGLFAALQLGAAPETCQSSTEAFRNGILSLQQNGFRFEGIDFNPTYFFEYYGQQGLEDQRTASPS